MAVSRAESSPSTSALAFRLVLLVWQTHKAAVEDELRDILGVNELDSKDPGYFQQHNAAAKRVLDKMNEQEKEDIRAIVEDRKARGNPTPIKRE